MSEVANIIIVKPVLVSHPVKSEHMFINGMKCVNCNGVGHFTQPKGYHGSGKVFEELKCKICEGSGKLKASIEITWTPDTAE